MTKRRRTSRKSLGREGSPHGGNGLHAGMSRVLRQLQAHKLGKKTKLFTEYGKYRVVDKAGNEDPQYFIKLAKAEKRKDKANAKGIRTKQ
tara:strand:- start:37 stop:306 length:270 start_codon:yes stop_codon:yes gene_type:complete